MITGLPEGYRFADQFELTPERVDSLFNNVIEASDLDNAALLNIEDIAPSADVSTEEKDIFRIAMGVHDGRDNLIAFIGATLDTNQQHATVETLAVHPDERKQGIGTALADKFCEDLDLHGAETISFQRYGEIDWLLPHLQEQQGFTYERLNQEYTSKRQPRNFTLEALGIFEPEPSDPAEAQSPEQPLTDSDIAIFKSTLDELIKGSVAYATAQRWAVANWGTFRFEVAGRQFTVRQHNLKKEHSWHVTEDYPDEALITPTGPKIIFERNYKVATSADKTGPDTLEFSQSVGDPVWDVYGKQKVVAEESPFTVERLAQLMSWLSRLDPAQHLIKEPEPLAHLKPNKRIIY